MRERTNMMYSIFFGFVFLVLFFCFFGFVFCFLYLYLRRRIRGIHQNAALTRATIVLAAAT